MSPTQTIGHEFPVVMVTAGKATTHDRNGREWRTAYVKQPIDGVMHLGPEGLEDDEQADTRYHGGPDKALCVYPIDHYDFWELKLGRELGPAAFGENVALANIDEKGACIGDVFEWGDAVVQISEPREPCANIARRWGVSELTEWVRETGFTGWYMRVLESAEVSGDDPWVLAQRPHPEYTIARLNRLMDEPGRDLTAVRRLAELDVLGEAWRAKFGDH